jgi:hypothetical protein
LIPAASENSFFTRPDTRGQSAGACAAQPASAAAQPFASSFAVPCAWCGVHSVDGNHGSLAECVDALKREVDTLRRELAAQQRAKDGPQKEASETENERLPWKFRNG